MILRSCKIENFGKLSNFTYEFEEGINIICEDNGWGKSTLTAFIKAMLYGLSKKSTSEVKDKEIGDERKRYAPWQGGVYGGELVFSVGDNIYKVKRVFGTTPAKDKFYLFDAITNKESKAYSQNIGMEIFHLDANSFERTILLSEKDSSYEINPMIQSKLGNLVDEADDIKNYKVVMEKIDDEMVALKSKKGIGFLDKIKKNILTLESEVYKIRTYEEKYKLLYEKKDGLQLEVSTKIQEEERLNIQENEYHDRRVRQEAIKNYYEEKDNYIQLMKQLIEYKELIPENNVDSFNEDVEELLQDKITYIQKKAELESYALTEEERVRFHKLSKYSEIPYPKEEEMNDIEALIEELNRQKESLRSNKLHSDDEFKLEIYKDKFKEDEINFDYYISLCEESEHIHSGIEAKRKMLEMLEKTSGVKTDRTSTTIKWNKGLIILSILLALIGFTSLGINMGLSVILLLSSITVLIIEIIGYKKKSRKASEDGIIKSNSSSADRNNPMVDIILEAELEEKQYNDIIESIQSFLKTYSIPWDVSRFKKNLYDLRDEYKVYRSIRNRKIKYDEMVQNSEIPSLELRIRQFFTNYKLSFDNANLTKELNQFKSDMKEYKGLLRKLDKQNHLENECNNIEKPICRFLVNYDYSTEDDLFEQLETIKKILVMYQSKKNDVESSKKRLSELKQKHQISDQEGVMRSKNIEHDLINLKEKQEELKLEIEKLKERDKLITEEILRTQQELTELYNKKSELQVEREKEIEYDKKYDILSKTQSYLEQAKESYVTRFKKPLEQAFETYYTMLTSIYPTEFNMDIDGKLSVDAYGEPRNTKFLSSGYTDLLNICMRMAIVDAMYDNEYPVLVYDDPFVHLDNDKLEGAKELLRQISSKYQIIYFTCHDSRM